MFVSQELETLKKDLEEKMDQHGALQTLLGYKPRLDEAARVTGCLHSALASTPRTASTRTDSRSDVLQIQSNRSWRRAEESSEMRRRST